MKRMVENSEKIEELADAVEITEDDLTIKRPYLLIDALSIEQDITVNGPAEFYDKLDANGTFRTSNITTPKGTVLNVINDQDYSISNNEIIIKRIK